MERTTPPTRVPPHLNQHPPLMRLIHEISRLTHEKIRADCPDIQHSFRLIMMELARRDNVTQLDLVRATHLKAPTISVTLQKMEKEGLVSRRPDDYDLRVTRVTLTEKGRELDNQVLTRFRQEEKRIEECLTAEERDALDTILMKIRSYLTGGNDSLEKR